MGTKKNVIAIGTRVALSANFLRNTGQQVGSAGSRRGTVLSMDNIFARVRWDDAPDYTALAKQWGEDYADDVRANGSMVNLGNLAAVGSGAMSAN
jgi:hypothetical protein